MIVFQPEPIGKHDAVFTDIENNEYLVHSIILQHKSTVFREMKFDQNEKLKLDVNPNVAISFFQTVYSQRYCDIETENLCKLWKLLVEYNIETHGILKDICHTLNDHNVTIDDDFLVDTVNLAVQFKEESVRTLVMDLILRKSLILSALLVRLPVCFLVEMICKLKEPKPLAMGIY